MNITTPAPSPPPAARLRRHLVAAVVLKVLAIIAIYFAFFSPAHRAPTDPGPHIAGPVVPLR